MGRKIDVHHHFVPDAYIAGSSMPHPPRVFQLTSYVAYDSDPSGWQLLRWSVNASLEHMDANGTDVTILSLTAPGTSILQGPAASDLARKINLEAAKIRDENPTQFGFFATLPPLAQDVEPVLKEIRYALDVLKADGVTLYTRHGTRNHYLGHATFKPVWDLLDERIIPCRFTEWTKQYGGIFTLKVGTKTMAVLTDRRLVKDLIDRKSALYNQRPPSHVSQLITNGDHLLVMDHGETWRACRRLIHQNFKEQRCETDHIPLIQAECSQMMHDFLTHPGGHMSHFKRTSNSIIMSLLFGIRTESCTTKHFVDLYDLMDRWSEVMELGSTPPVDIFPILKILPQSWFNNWIDRSKDVGTRMKTLYAEMIVKEAIRWRPVTPLAFPHALAEDDFVNGVHLPKSTTVMINVWGLHHDPLLFPDPEKFDPSRFEGKTRLAATYAASADYSERDHYVYGSGRRICPGIHLAERELFLGTAKLLWGHRIEQKSDASGMPIPIETDPEVGYTEGFLVCPKHFDCKVTPRSQSRAETIIREHEIAKTEIFINYD